MKNDSRSHTVTLCVLGILAASPLLLLSCAERKEAPVHAEHEETSVPSAEDGLYRFNIDLDGDRTAEPIVVSLAPGKEPPNSTATVDIRGERFSTDHIDEGWPIPELRVIRIDHKRQEKQLLLKTVSPAFCIFDILSFTNGKIVPLLHFESVHSCEGPTPNGNGTVRITEWQGFWSQEDTLRLSSDGMSLVKEPVTTYSVGVAGVAMKPISLEGDDCPSRIVQSGTYVKVKSYDPIGKRYLLETSDGGCGWLEEGTLSDEVGELPHAG
jgi:hypothetical protein